MAVLLKAGFNPFVFPLLASTVPVTRCIYLETHRLILIILDADYNRCTDDISKLMFIICKLHARQTLQFSLFCCQHALILQDKLLLN